MRGIRDTKDKKAEGTEKNHLTRVAKNTEDIAKKTTLEKANLEELEAIEDNGKIVEAVRKPTNPRMASVLVMYGKTVRVQTSKETLKLDFIVALNALGVFNNGAVA